MSDYPKKLAAYFEALSPEERPAREKLYQETLEQALQHKLQSPQFWAARQIMTGLTEGQIQHKIQKRMRRVLKVDPDAEPQPRPASSVRVKRTPVQKIAPVADES